MKNKLSIIAATIILNFGYFLSLGQNVKLNTIGNQPPLESKVLCATVISDKSTYIIWEPSKASNFASYRVYRQDLSTGNYILIKTIGDISFTNFSDDSLNTLVNSYCYKVQTVDTLGYAISIDSLQEHCTMNATANGVNGGVEVKWNSYVGARVDSYSIYRVELNNTAPVLVAKVPSDVLTILDTNVYCPVGFSYRVKANKLNGNFVSSYSDTSITKPIFVLASKSLNNLLRSTILNNNAVLTKWEAPIGSVKPIAEYAIYKSSDNVNFSFLTSVPSTEHHFIDNGADVSSGNYYYNIEAKDDCGITTKGGDENSSLLLKAKAVGGNIQLNWTKYAGRNIGIGYSMDQKLSKNQSLGSIEKVENSNAYQ